MYVYNYICMFAIITREKYAKNLKESKEGYIGDFG